MLKGFRTLIFNVVMGIVMLLRALGADTEMPTEEQVSAAIDSLDVALTAIWAIGNLLLRAITDSPIFKKEPKR